MCGSRVFAISHSQSTRTIPDERGSHFYKCLPCKTAMEKPGRINLASNCLVRVTLQMWWESVWERPQNRRSFIGVTVLSKTVSRHTTCLFEPSRITRKAEVTKTHAPSVIRQLFPRVPFCSSSLCLISFCLRACGGRLNPNGRKSWLHVLKVTAASGKLHLQSQMPRACRASLPWRVLQRSQKRMGRF